MGSNWQLIHHTAFATIWAKLDSDGDIIFNKTFSPISPSKDCGGYKRLDSLLKLKNLTIKQGV